MKPFLGINLTTDKTNETINGREFLIQTPSAALSNTFTASLEKANETIERAKLPLLLRIVQYICGFVGGLFAVAILKADVSFAEGYHNAPWITWTGAICLVIWLVLKLASTHKEKTLQTADENTQTFSHLDKVAAAVYAELSVPSDAKEVDVLLFYYKVKDGNIKVCEKGMQVAHYFNPVFRVFSDAEYLYLANLEGKYAFPLSSITGIRTVKKRVIIARWNKEERYNKSIYKQYKLTTDNYGGIHCKSYHILELNLNGETWGIFFPSYELPAFEEITKQKNT